MTPDTAAEQLWDVLCDIGDGIIDARATIKLAARRNLIRAAGTVGAAADHLIEVVWKGDHSVEPPGWRLHQPESDEEWACVRDDGRLAGCGKTRELAIADAWREAERRDLYALGARLCLEQARERNAHGDGFVLVWMDMSRPPGDAPSWTAFIVTSFGAHHSALREIEADAELNGWGTFGLDSTSLPECEQLECLCRVVYEEAEADEFGRVTCPSATYLEIVELDGALVIEVHG